MERKHYEDSSKHLYVLPVLLLEFLALSLTRAVIPTLLLDTFGDNVYFVMGCAEAVRGMLAFLACPAFGKISDIVGRKICLFVTVLGTCMPVCSLAIMSWQKSILNQEQERHRIWIFVVFLALSGVFSSTFTLTFAYISDVVKRKKDRVTAYGLALATFGLSFTIGPMAGGYLAHVEQSVDVDIGDTSAFDESSTEDYVSTGHVYLHPLGQKRVFTMSLVLTVLDLLYIYFILPESVEKSSLASSSTVLNDDDMSVITSETRNSFSDRWHSIREDIFPKAWSPFDTLKIFGNDPFMKEVAKIAFLYYTSLWAVVSTLTLYAAKRFHLGPERLGELMSALGLSTMVSEAIIVRIVVPLIGEKRSIQVGLLAFTLQCIVLGVAFEGWQLFICVLLSMASNLVYPSLTSLVSTAVAPETVGEALGAINGVKALTEGVGPLLFGTLMTFSEKSPLPGWPYILASMLVVAAYKRTSSLPDENDEDYLSEKYEQWPWSKRGKSALSEIAMTDKSDNELTGLLSEIEEVDEDEFVKQNLAFAQLKVQLEKCKTIRQHESDSIDSRESKKDQER
jgi:MFS transporter, DHA1 family, tetracycline resistance protein